MSRGRVSHKTKSRIAFGIAGCLAAVLIAIFLVMLYFGQKAEVSPSPNMEVSEAEYSDDDGFPYIDWDYWLSVNPDIIGWVTVPGTNIDYPIVQASADDPTYYLKHDVYKDYNVYGCPYLDADCAETGLFGSMNSVVFGHHMTNNSMFSDFANFSNLDYATEHRRILVQTPDEKRVYLAQAAEIIPGWSAIKRTSFSSLTDFQAWYGGRLSGCTVRFDDAAAVDEDHIITFCTCSYNIWSWNERTLVYAAPEDTASE